jgi:uncharacterized protein YqeY
MIKDQIKKDQLQALKNKDQARVNILRYILSKIQNQEIATQKNLTENEEIAVLQKIKKELNESLASGEKAGRQELISQAKAELAVVSSYLPPELSDEQLKKEIEKLIAQNQELYQKNPKALIGLCIKSLKNVADSSRIIAILNSLS